MRIVLAVVGLLLAAHAHAQTLFETTFSNPDAGGTGRYGFASRVAPNTPPNGWPWSTTHLPTGNYNGGGAAQVNIPRTGSSGNQGILGWQATWSHSWTLGDSIYFAVRIKFPDGGIDDFHRQKFILFGSGTDSAPISQGGDSDYSRTIVYLLQHGEGLGSIGDNSGFYGAGTQFRPASYGVTLPGNNWTGGFMGLRIGRNVDGPGTIAVPPIAVTTAGNSNRGTPGMSPNPGAAAADGWYHCQWRIRSGAAGVGFYQQWCNNNDGNNPNGTVFPVGGNPQLPLHIGLQGGWNAINLVSFMDNDPATDVRYVLGGFKVSTTFISDWYPGGSDPDTEAPTVTITSPTSSATTSVAGTPLTTLAGTCSDNVAVSSVTWSTSAGGSGTASGTTSWSVASITLARGLNVITVTCTDAADNSAQDVIAVTFTPRLLDFRLRGSSDLPLFVVGGAAVAMRARQAARQARRRRSLQQRTHE